MKAFALPPFCLCVFLFFLPSPAVLAAEHGGRLDVLMYKNAGCACCNQWAAHLEKNGFRVKIEESANLAARRRALGMDERFSSCHTAKIGKILVEGHVPAADVRRLLAEQSRPKTARSDVIGLAAPGMPQGSPGMESEQPEDFDTLLIRADGSSSVYRRHLAKRNR
ncbi:MAG: DUF411 domain-containing protein [Zoogloeaceae bacterium]|jgi:hypothetical protein|nr:DUF411 domain-containing protein [Zoogloeaceae bacterium]